MIRNLLTEVERRDKVSVISLKGEISSLAKDSFFDAYDQANRQKTNAILLDMLEVEYINSAGIALIIRMVSDARERGSKVAVSGLSDHYREIFHITRLDDFVSIYSDRETALKALSNDHAN